MLSPKDNWIEFTEDLSKVSKLIELGVLSKTTKKLPKFLYKGFYMDNEVSCNVVGYNEDNDLILDVSGNLHCINPLYFKDMQKKSFSRYGSLDGEL